MNINVLNIDVVIVLVFLVTNLGVGLRLGRGIKTIKEYAIGDRNFSTATIAATIIATWISGSYFTVSVTQTYKDGLWFSVPTAVGEIIALLIIGRVLGPRMKEFFGDISVAESMGRMYGKNIRIITAICSIAQAVGMTALQIKVFSTIFGHFLGFSSLYATIISTFVVTLYSAYGGIKAVTFTDVIQFITFGVFIPIFAIFVWQTLGDFDAVSDVLQNNPQYSFSELFNVKNPKFLPTIFLLIYFTIPGVNSTLFQRTLMARDTDQIKQSFTVAAFVAFFISMTASFIGFLIFCHNPNLDSSKAVLYVLDTYSFPGLKGLAIIGIISMIMSTADSWINTASVTFAHDFCKPLGLKNKTELLFSKFCAVFVGFGATFLALKVANILNLILLVANFYRPIVTVPLIFAVLGFRPSTRVVLIAMASGLITSIIWRNFIQPSTGIESVSPAMIANLLGLFSSYYILGEKDGWINREKVAPATSDFFLQKNISIVNLAAKFEIVDFNIILQYCLKHSPKLSQANIYFAACGTLTMFATFSLNSEIYQKYVLTVNILQAALLLISTSFICFSLWPEYIKEKYSGLIWYMATFFTLSFVSSFLVVLSNFSQAAVIIFILNLSMLGVLLSWKSSLIMTIAGVLLTSVVYQGYTGNDLNQAVELYGLKLKVFYIIFMITGFMMTFVKPKQEMHEQVIAKNTILSSQVHDREEELKKSLELKNEFIRNINHEVRTPITGIASLGQALLSNYRNLNEEERFAAIEAIAGSSARLIALTNNILDLSKLTNLSLELNLQNTNLSELVNTRLHEIERIYLGQKPLEFIVDIQPNIIVNCDKYYIKQTIDNLLLNAISYSHQGAISINLVRFGSKVQFSIEDQGIGIPKDELYDIFQPFVVSSKTRNYSGGRGVGLALCSKTIELHYGKIWAESDGETGAKFIFMI